MSEQKLAESFQAIRKHSGQSRNFPAYLEPFQIRLARNFPVYPETFQPIQKLLQKTSVSHRFDHRHKHLTIAQADPPQEMASGMRKEQEGDLSIEDFQVLLTWSILN